MREWLLKEDKAKVGRPKLADNEAVRKAKILIFICLFSCAIMAFSFISIIKGVSPFRYAYALTIEKLVGSSENPDGFITKSYYDDNYNYVMEIKIPRQVSSYSGNYKYSTYYLKDDNWVKKETKEFPKDTDKILVRIDALKNKNVTWKIDLQILNAAAINKSYAPSGWTFVDANKQEDKRASKVFTVKGYYSPVPIDEIKEVAKKKDKLSVATSRDNPRAFTLNLPANGSYDVVVKYTDTAGKEVTLAKDSGITGKKVYQVPNLDRSTKVSFKIWGINTSVKDLKLSRWSAVKDKHGNYYVTNTYVLKPARSYEN